MTTYNDKLNKLYSKLNLIKSNFIKFDELYNNTDINNLINDIENNILELDNQYKHTFYTNQDYDRNNFDKEYNNLGNEIIKFKLEYYPIINSKLLKINNLELLEIKYLLHKNYDNFYLKIIMILLMCIYLSIVLFLN